MQTGSARLAIKASAARSVAASSFGRPSEKTTSAAWPDRPSSEAAASRITASSGVVPPVPLMSPMISRLAAFAASPARSKGASGAALRSSPPKPTEPAA